MKKIILNTNNANEVSTDKKNYKYYFDRPIVIDDKSTLSLQSITQKGGLATSSTPNSTGLLHLGGLTPFVYNGVPSNYNWTLNAGGYVEEMSVDLTNSAEALVVASDAFTVKTPGVDYNSGSLKCLIYNDTTTTFNSPQTLLVVSAITDLGSDFQVGWYILIKKRPTGVTYIGNGLNNPLFTITSVKDSLMYQDGYLLYQETVGAFNPIVSQYAGEVNQSLDAGYTSPNVDLGQGLIVKFRTNTNNPSLIEIDNISSGGYGYSIGDYIYINKKNILSSSSGTDFLLPLKLQVISNTPPASTPQPVYTDGLLTIGNLAIDYSTIPTSIYGTFSYVAEWSVDLNDNTKCTVFRSNGGASVGANGVISFFTFRDYSIGGFPKTTVCGEVTSFGKNYRVGDYIIINQTAFPTGYVTGTVNMRVDITGVSTSEITEYPKGIITGVTLNPNYIGEVSTNTNYTHSPGTQNGQNTDFVWGAGFQYLELKEIVNGGVGYSVGDIFYVNKNDALPTSSTYFTPFQVTVNSISNTVTPPPPNPDGTFKISAKNLLHINNNIFNSYSDNNVLIYNKENALFVNRDELINYRICELPPQVLMGVELFVESTKGIGLSQNDILIIDLKIS